MPKAPPNPIPSPRFPGGPRGPKKRRVYFIAAAKSEGGRRIGPFEDVVDENGLIKTESKWEAQQIVNYLEARGYIAYYEEL